jgi:hypothetical protein
MVNSDFPACNRLPSFDCDDLQPLEDHDVPEEHTADPSEPLQVSARLIRANYEVLARVNAVLQTTSFRLGF